MNSSSPISHESISRRAYQIWEEAGHPHGSHTDHWLQAERDLHALHAKTSGLDAVRGKSVEPPAPAKHVPERAPHSTNYAHPGIATDALHHNRNR